MPFNPKFEQKINERVVAPQFKQQPSSGYGIVIAYDSTANTASVLMASKNSMVTGQMYTNVICPTTIGVNAVAPEAGRPCWVDFKGETETFPVITHYFNHLYEKYDYNKQNSAVNNVPKFMLGI